MASWILVPCLQELRSEFNQLAPDRDKASDGSIGDAAHAGSSSDHNPDETGVTPYEDADNINEVHGIDVDKDLRKSGWSMQRAVGIIVGRHRRGEDNRLQNVIYDRRIWSRSWGWTARTYTGSNPHDKHAHFSARYTTAQESDRRPWGLLEAADVPEEDTMSAEDARAGIATFFREARHALLQTAHYQSLPDSDPDGGPSKARYNDALITTWMMDGVPNPGWSDIETNPNVTVLNSMKDGAGARVDIQKVVIPKMDSLEARLQGLESSLPAALSSQIQQDLANLRDEVNSRFDSVYTEVNEVPVETLELLGNPSTPDEQVANVLRQLLGDRKDAVVALLQAP